MYIKKRTKQSFRFKISVSFGFAFAAAFHFMNEHFFIFIACLTNAVAAAKANEVIKIKPTY